MSVRKAGVPLYSAALFDSPVFKAFQILSAIVNSLSPAAMSQVIVKLSGHGTFDLVKVRDRTPAPLEDAAHIALINTDLTSPAFYELLKV